MNTEKIVKGLLDQLEDIVYNESRQCTTSGDACTIANNTVIEFRSALADTIKTLAENHNV